MQTVRTPDDRFANLPDFSFEPHYSEVPDGEGGSLRIHHLDEGPADGELILCLHGQPTWSFLYRKMIPVFVEMASRRCRIILPMALSSDGRVASIERTMDSGVVS